MASHMTTTIEKSSFTPKGIASCLSFAPLLLAWNAIVVSVHLHAGAVLKEVGCFRA
jgi:hypothetical protein